MSDSRKLDRCGVCSLLGERAADELFGCIIPAGLDMDHAADVEIVAAVMREEAPCETCERRG